MSSEPQRPKRPELPRSAPIRSLQGFFGPPRDRNGHGAVPPRADTGSSATDPVAYGVDLGYRVIEDYLRQGQAFARGATAGSDARRPPALDPQRLIERMVQQASDLAAAWLDYIQIMNGNPRGASDNVQPTGHGGAFDFDAAARKSASDAGADGETRTAEPEATPAPAREDALDVHSPPSPSLALAIDAKRPIEVSCELKPGAGRSPLLAHDLRAVDPALGRISGIQLELRPADARIVLRVSVSAEQAAGVYSGLIVDAATNLPQGTLSVRVG